MKTKYFLIGSALALLIIGSGCSKDNDPTDTVPLIAGCDKNKSWSEQTETESNALKATITTFAISPSKATCESFREAYIVYIEALEKVNTCVIGEHEAAFLQALKDGKAELANIDCNADFGG